MELARTLGLLFLACWCEVACGTTFTVEMPVEAGQEVDEETLRTFADLLAQSASPMVVVVPRGETVVGTLTNRCGRLDATFLKLLRDQYSELNPDLSMGIEEASLLTREVVVPFCFEVPPLPIVEVNVLPQDAALKYFHTTVAFEEKLRQESQLLRPTFQWQQPPKEWDWVDYVQASQEWGRYKTVFQTHNPSIKDLHQLQAGSRVALPLFKPPFMSVAFTAEGEQQFRDTLALQAGPVPELHPEEPGKLIASVSLEELERQNEDCGTFRPASLPFDGPRLAANLALNQELRQRFPGLPQVRQTTVLVADTGLQGYELPPFGAKMVALEGTMDSRSRLQAYPSYPHSSHGTSVAGLVLGGPWFAGVNTLLGPRIQVAIARAMTAHPESPGGAFRFEFPPSELANAAARALEQQIPIVNVSLQYAEKDLSTFKRAYLDRSNEVLFVVAAGNQARQLSNHERGRVYPARYGGGDSAESNVITVAASTWDDRLAKFSNRGRAYVDLAALGCRVPTYAFDKEKATIVEAEMSGTSFAAPLVSLAAALIKTEVPGISSGAIKRRLLYSADHLALADAEAHVRNGRRLNIEKAVGVFTDIVETVDGRELTGKVVFDDGQNSVDFCDEALLGRDGLLRLEKVSDVAGFEIFHQDSDGKILEPARCAHITNRIAVHDPFSEQATILDASEVRNIVFAYRPYYYW